MKGDRMLCHLLAVGLLAAAPVLTRAEDTFFLRDGQRVVFVGDSITFAGHFIAYLDGYLTTRFPDKKIELLNLGLPSETVTGLSEPDHPFPRPDVHERLDRVLARTKPDVLVACYGINDGIYYPFSDERFTKYQDGIRRLIDRGTKAGAKVVLLTPPPFDPRPLKDKLLPKSTAKFSWLKPYEGYDEVLQRYAEWLRGLRSQGLMVIDVHTAVRRHLDAIRATDPDYRLADDGVHIGRTGHWPIAQEILRAWNAPADVDEAAIDARALKAVKGQLDELSAEGGVLRFRWRTRLPMPADPGWDSRLAKQQRLAERVNRHRLAVTGAAQERYELFEGDHHLGDVSGKQLAEGVDLLVYKELSTNRRAAELAKLLEQRQDLLGRAWLSDVGHKRPNTPKGLPLEEARQRAAALEAEIRKLAQPVQISLRLSPSK
jgi:lysophospholipase L1-like esterase